MLSLQHWGLGHPNCTSNLDSTRKPSVKGATSASCICLTMILYTPQAAERQIFAPMSHHMLVHFLPFLPLLKAGSIPALCTIDSAPGLLAQWDGATGMDYSPCCLCVLHLHTLPMQPQALSQATSSLLQHSTESRPALNLCNGS